MDKRLQYQKGDICPKCKEGVLKYYADPRSIKFISSFNIACNKTILVCNACEFSPDTDMLELISEVEL